MYKYYTIRLLYNKMNNIQGNGQHIKDEIHSPILTHNNQKQM